METLHIYTRVSTAAQANDGTSLATQTELGIIRAKELGFECKIWNEGGKSSDSDDIATRPVFLELYSEIGKGNVKHVYVFDKSRISRNDYVSSLFRTRCTKHGVTLYTKDGVYDFSNATDKLVQQVLDAISQFDNSLRVERSRHGKISRVKAGSWHGGTPVFGYRLENKKLVPEKSEKEWVKKIFQLYNNNYAPSKIKQELESNAVRTRRGSLIWNLGSISALLKNTHYIGYYVFTDNKTKETITVKCPQILDETLWHSVQEKSKRANSRVLQQNATKHFYLLRDIMYCGHCNKPIRGRISEKNYERVYYCGYKEMLWKEKGGSDTPWQRGFGCGLSRSLNIPATDKLVWDTAIKIHRDSALLNRRV